MAAGDKASTHNDLLAIALDPATNGNAQKVQAVTLVTSSGAAASAAAGGVASGTDTTNSASSTAAGAVAATLAAAAGVTTYITGFEVTGAGATAASVVAVTVTGLVGGTATYFVAVPAGASAALPALVVEFTRPIPASAVNTAIVVSVPSLGAGNVASAVVAHGFRV